VHQDAVEALIVAGTWTAPKAGTTAVTLPGGKTIQWNALKASADGVFDHADLHGGYLFFTLPSKFEHVAILDASGHDIVYVNGEPRAGDPYGQGYVHLPILLRPGDNELLFHVGRGRLRARLVAAKAETFIDPSDVTLPDLLTGHPVEAWGAAVVCNASATQQNGLCMEVACAGGEATAWPVPSLSPLSTRKIAFRIRAPAPRTLGSCTVSLTLVGRHRDTRKVLDTANLSVKVCHPHETHKRTFQSGIDGSIQYCAVVPPKREDPGANGTKPMAKPALILTLHGAAVEGIGQAACFAPKPNTYVVAPTNRRPFGFDWEDWGRLDFLEVLALSQKQLDIDPQRTYLTGHSMGGHGTWHLGATYPDRFAAIGPSAGWMSMWSYAGAQRAAGHDYVTELTQRANSPSDTLALARNYAHHGVFVLHGDQDDNVPVDQARIMRQQLAVFHSDFVYYERPGAGHWWGNPCVDWPPMYEFFARHTIPKPSSVRRVDFVTASPGVSARSHWAVIEAQLHCLKFSTFHLSYDVAKRTFTGTTENVARLRLHLDHVEAGKPMRVQLDADRLDVPDASVRDENGRRIWFARQQGHWHITARPSSTLKGPARYGPFKDAFQNRMQFVYGTQGTPAENAWALAKARFDAETFWYRGNGSVDVIADTAYEPTAEPDRNVILYGNAETNGAWNALLAESPVQVRRGRIRVGGHDVTGEDLACLLVRPRIGSDHALVGVVAGSGVAGMRLTDRLPYFISGVGYPDCLILGSNVLRGNPAGIRVAGYFGQDWSVGGGDFAWHEPDNATR
jgi:pimeloyl-ACP methyl ester carboxylesterase